MRWFGRPISNQPTGQSYQFFDLKIQIYYSHSSIFCRSCQIQCFLDTVNAISKRLNYLSCVFASKYSSNSVQKAVDLTTPAKNRRKISTYKRFEFSDQKVYGFGLQAGLKLAFKITLTKPNILWNVNAQIATVWFGSKHNWNIQKT